MSERTLHIIFVLALITYLATGWFGYALATVLSFILMFLIYHTLPEDD